MYPPPKMEMPSEFRVDDDKFIPSLKDLADSIKKYDCPAFMQIFGGGPMMGRRNIPGMVSVSSSAISKEDIPIPEFSACRELSVAEIEEIVKLFADDVERLHKAGFNGIELNGGCNHLLNAFLSRAWNKRQDAYGGSLEKRAKIMADIIKEIKRRNGKDFAVIALINGAEPGLKDGLTPDESSGIAKVLETAGADAIHVRCEFYTRPKNPDMRNSTHFPDNVMFPEPPQPLEPYVDTSHHGAGGWLPVAAAVKKVVTIPVIAVGRLNLDIGEDALRKGMADFITFNRRLMADHELPNKVISGRLEDIRPCTGCFTCFSSMETGNSALCQVNAALGKEREYEIKPAIKKKKVMIIGGGPAGMETARVAALRGHQVILCDKESKLGGAMRLAATVKGFDKEDTLGLVHYLKTQITKLGVDIRLGKEVTRATVEEVKPNVLVIAAGGIHNIPQIPGINKSNVVTAQTLHTQLRRYMKFFSPQTIRWLTKFYLPVGKNVVVMGGDIQGCEAAEFLIKRGRKVTIVETGESIGEGLLVKQIKPFLLDWLDKKGTTMLTGVKYEEITDKGLVITTKDGKKQTIAADTVMTALPLLPNTKLIESLKGVVPEIYTIGDCNEPQLIVNATGAGSRTGRAI
jgi:2,4-dienoyl-CoA reductase (NADPH2)